jgi:hypothetical protein
MNFDQVDCAQYMLSEGGITQYLVFSMEPRYILCLPNYKYSVNDNQDAYLSLVYVLLVT